ncbi:hypothetical protein G7046_g7615 [Stylonectria norvegica]|nr:hypothetical protein G7046_g7615 [Stylonectria norvegica]
MAQTITVNPEVAVASGSGDTFPTVTCPSTNSAQWQSFPSARTSQGARPRAKSASNLLTFNRPSQGVHFQDDTSLNPRQKTPEENGIAELIDFLRNQAPPSDNFMSIPDEDDSDRGRWALLKRLGKKTKGRYKGPQQIRLPDSAVSGITIGGHRHIAISIPLNASPFGQNPRTQYPVSPYRDLKPITSRYAPTRTILNEKGVVTVLQAVTEDHEASSSPRPNGPTQHQLCAFGPRPRAATDQSRGPPNLPAGHIKSSSYGNSIDYYRVPPNQLRAQIRDELGRPQNVSAASQRQVEVESRPSPPTKLVSFPGRATQRSASLTMKRPVFLDSSIDAVISHAAKLRDHEPMTPTLSRKTSRDGPRQKTTGNTLDEKNKPDIVVAGAREEDSKTTSLLGGSYMADDFPLFPPKKKPEGPPITVITESPLARNNEKYQSPTKTQPKASAKATTPERNKARIELLSKALPPTPCITSTKASVKAPPPTPPKSPKRNKSPTPSIKSTQSRREKVRDKKRRDIEALRNAQRRRSQLLAESEASGSRPPEVSNQQPGTDLSEKVPETQDSPLNRPTICPIMVVADVQPSPSIEREQPLQLSIGQTKTTSEVRSLSEPATPTSTTPPKRVDSSDNPTPPPSTRGSPPYKQVSLDRTSLSRRREWNATRDRERRAREVKAAIRSNIKQPILATEAVNDDSKIPIMEKEVLRRYEAYREYRIREMERRVRRLERNGDVWLRALVPVLDNLNRTLANVHEDAPERAQGWVSDEETTGAPDHRGRSITNGRQKGKGRTLRRGNSEQEMFEQLVREKEDLDDGNDSGSDDMSGFETIEPLMRELAGRSRLSFEAKKTLEVDS